MPRSTFAGMVLIGILAAAAPARALDNVRPPLGALYMSPESSFYVGVWEWPPIMTAVEFQLYLVAEIDFSLVDRTEQNGVNGPNAWEASISFPAELALIGTTLFPEGSAVDLNPSASDYQVGTGATMPAGPAPIVLAEFTVLLLGQTRSMRLDLGAVEGPTASFDGVPGWAEGFALNGCTNQGGFAIPCLFPFDFVGDLSLVWPSTETETWGALKARFD